MHRSSVTLLVLALAAGGCSAKDVVGGEAPDAGSTTAGGDSGTPAATAILWNVDLGTNDPSVCPVAAGDTWSIGSFTGSTLVTVASGSTFGGVPVSVSCDVSQGDGGTYSVVANVQYGSEGSLKISGTVATAPGAPSEWPPQSGVQASFDDNLGLVEDLSENDCTISFSQNPNMGVTATRIWGSIDCPHAASPDGKTCDGNAEFLFESCGQ